MPKLDLQMFLASNTRFLLDQKGWSGAELARRAGVPKQFVTDILSGRSPRGLANLRKVAVALDVGSIDALVFSDLSKKPVSKKSESPMRILESFFDGTNDVYHGRFEVALTVKKLKNKGE